MRLKKKTGEISDKIEKSNIYANITKNAGTIFEFMKNRGVEITFLGFLFLFASGIVNGLIEGTSPFMQNYVIFPQRGLQTVPETFVYLFAMISGSLGFYLLYTGGRQSIKQRISSFYFLIGFSTILLAMVISLYIFNIKV